jgi:heptosyltransferase II
MKNNNPNIVVYRTQGIGDVILTFESLKLLLQYEVNIFFVGYNPSLSLVQFFFPNIITISIEDCNIRESIKKINSSIKKIDFIIDFQKNSKSFLIIGLLRLFHPNLALFQIRRKSLHRRFVVLLNILTGRKYKPKMVKRYNQISIGLQMLQLINSKILLHLEKKTNNENPHYIIECNKYKKISEQSIIIATGSKHEIKKLPDDIVVKIVVDIKQQFNKLKVYLVGDCKDIELNNRIENKLKDVSEIHNFTNRKSLVELIPFICSSKMVLSADSSLLHLAQFLETPTTVILGPTIKGYGYAVDKTNGRVFSEDLACKPCTRHGKRKCIYNDYKCFSAISALEVSKHIQQHLKK